ncbi:MAG TPA: M14 family metallopeptidase [Saprospiraceae bacterium]|nr:M14 family metallopeptidase [Saprospiraceae bacterium]
MSFLPILQQNDLIVEPGKKMSGFISIPGTPVKMPTTVISSKNPGKKILITGGVHGGEYPCIETAIRLARTLQAADISGTLVIIHPVNTAAFMARMQYYGPYDGKNLNRVFPGKATGTVSERIAYTVHQLQKAADFYIDLHGGDIHESLTPFVIYSKVGGPKVAEQSKKAAASLGFPYVVGSTSENGSIGAASSTGTPGFLAELGQCGRWSEEEVEAYLRAVKNVLTYLECLEGTLVEYSGIQFLDQMHVVKAKQEGCWYPSKKLKEEVQKGEKIGEIRDFFGKQLSSYYAPEAGRLLYLVTSLAITEGDPLVAIG